MSDWVTKPLGELITLQRGHDLPSQDRREGDIPIMGSSGITGYHSEFKCKGPGVVVGRSGNSMGEVSFCPVDYWPLNTCLYITDFKGNDERYIYYLLQTINFDQFNSGSAQKSLNRNAVYPYEVRTTECKDEQIRIGRILADLEDKIELNRQANQTLEQIAQAIFKSWFVDFEPTRAKIAAKKRWKALNETTETSSPTCYADEFHSADQQNNWRNISLEEAMTQAAMAAISGKSIDELEQLSTEQLQQLKETAALFPDALVESELGEIPACWECGELRRIAYFSNDRVEVSKLTFENYISTENMLEGKKGISSASSLPTVKTVPSFKSGHILISNIRPYFMKIWLARFEGGRSNDVLGIEAKDPASTEYLYNLLYQDVFFNFMMTTSKGAKMPRGDKDAIMGWKCIQPSGEVKRAYSQTIGGFYKKIEVNDKESEKLELIRNALLPKLLSGEITSNTKENFQSSSVDTNEEIDQFLSQLKEKVPFRQFLSIERTSEPLREKSIGFMTVKGSFGEGGAVYIKVPRFLSLLEEAIGELGLAPFAGRAIAIFMTRIFSQKVVFDQATAITLLCFPNKLIRSSSELLERSQALCAQANIEKFDEYSLHSVLERLREHKLVIPIDEHLTSWRLIEKFRQDLW